MKLLFRRLAVIPAVLAVAFAAAAPAWADEVPDQLVVTFKPNVPASQRDAAAKEHGGTIFTRIEGTDTYGVALAHGPNEHADTRAKQQEFRGDARVADAEPNYLYQALFTPNDSSLGSQWAWSKIQAYAAWDVTQGSSATIIGVVDTGIQATHPDLDAKVVSGGWDYVQGDGDPTDGNGHGTHVSGTAAAETNNATGGAGMCPNCRILPVRVLDNNGSGSLTNVASGIRYAADHGAKIISLSLGGPGSTTLQSAVDYAAGKGVFLSCAAGNSNTSSTSSAYPGAYANCFAVASTNSSDARSSFSNYGSWVEVAAPGEGIYSTWIGSGYNTISGTSMATPHVSGLAGLLASQGLTGSQIRDRICSTADKIAGTGTYWTCGRINALAAVSSSAPPPPPPSSETILNGGFESGSANWAETSSAGYEIVASTRPHSGVNSAWLAGYNSGTDTISQTVKVPTNGTLSYWWYMTTQESGSTPYDYFRVRIYNSSGSLLATLRTFTNASGAGAWRQDSLALGSYAGQTVRVEFSATTDYSLPSSFFVDDVSLK